MPKTPYCRWKSWDIRHKVIRQCFSLVIQMPLPHINIFYAELSMRINENSKISIETMDSFSRLMKVEQYWHIQGADASKYSKLCLYVISEKSVEISELYTDIFIAWPVTSQMSDIYIKKAVTKYVMSHIRKTICQKLCSCYLTSPITHEVFLFYFLPVSSGTVYNVNVMFQCNRLHGAGKIVEINRHIHTYNIDRNSPSSAGFKNNSTIKALRNKTTPEPSDKYHTKYQEELRKKFTLNSCPFLLLYPRPLTLTFVWYSCQMRHDIFLSWCANKVDVLLVQQTHLMTYWSR